MLILNILLWDDILYQHFYIAVFSQSEEVHLIILFQVRFERPGWDNDIGIKY